MNLLGTAKELINLDFSVIPCGPDKKALISWKPYQNRIMTESEAQKHFANASRIAVIGGSVSGNLECLDFDDPATYEPFLEMLELRCPGLHGRLLKRRTPSGGYQSFIDVLNQWRVT